MDQDKLRSYEELRVSLAPLRRLLEENKASLSIFDEFMEHNEFGLALLTICDSILDHEGVFIEEGEMKAIRTLSRRMQMNDVEISQVIQRQSEFCNRARL